MTKLDRLNKAIDAASRYLEATRRDRMDAAMMARIWVGAGRGDEPEGVAAGVRLEKALEAHHQAMAIYTALINRRNRGVVVKVARVPSSSRVAN